MSHIFRASALIAVFFGLNKIVALVRQVIIARQFGLSSEIDAFNIANNLPDLVFSLFSGGALALAFIPVFSEYIESFGRRASWSLFSNTATVIFFVTALLALVIGIFAGPLVSSQWGIAPGFSPDQQELVVFLMRINLVAMLIFSVSGIVMASLQAHKHFLLPAAAPILYNIGQIFGALVLAPSMGVTGLAVGVVIGALLHLLVQVPGLFAYKFRYSFFISLGDSGFQKILRVGWPRIATVFLIQAMFLARDNLASRLGEGAVSALTYGYFLLQVPETLIGTSIATAMLPTLSQLIVKEKKAAFIASVNGALRVIVAITVVITALSILVMETLLGEVFRISSAELSFLAKTTNAFFLGLTAQAILEVLVRVFYAKQDATIPLISTLVRTILFFAISIPLYRSLGVVGIALIDSITITVQVAILAFVLGRVHPGLVTIGDTIKRTVISCVFGIGVYYVFYALLPFSAVENTLVALGVSGVVAFFLLSKDIRLISRL